MSLKKPFTLKNHFDKEKEEIYEILFCFIACGIIGWAFETIIVLVQLGRITDRGILFISHINDFPFVWGLPFIMIYGIGGAILIWCFKPLAHKPILLFFSSIIIMTSFEYLTAVFCEVVLKQKLWDYSEHFMNFQGRICLSSSINWGILSILAVKVLGPFFLKIYNKIKAREILHAIIVFTVIYILICYYLRPIMFPEIIEELGRIAVMSMYP